jgi:para-aminobenzoate synthetase/4-amino-4-deoxychorismate lyase
MEIIRELENGPRGVYTGAIGFWGPDRRAQFNVAIRTAVVDCETGRAEYGAGGGIVWDSDPEAEYRECLLKTKVLTATRPDFDLLETLRWNPGEGFFLLDRHLDRLADSAGYFGFPCDRDRTLAALGAAVLEEPGGSLKVRLLLSPDGSLRCETAVQKGPPFSFDELLSPRDGPVRPAAPAAFPVDRSQATLYHKTTRREVYERAKEDLAGDEGEVLLWNEAGEATEFTASNLVARIGGGMVTPPVASGLLPGTLRAELLARGVVVEGVMLLKDLARAEAVWAVNSVRGWRRVRLRFQ